MQAVYLTCLLAIGVTWVWAWGIGCGWCRACGVGERFSLWALACVLPTSGLIGVVHVLAFASLISGRGVIGLEAVTILFAALVFFAGRAVHRAGFNVPAAPDPEPDERLGTLGLWWAPILVLLGIYAVFLVDALTRYPTGYDAVNYHLPMAVTWARERAMNMVLSHAGYCFPGNGMIVTCLLSFAKLERVFPIVHFPKALLLAAVVIGLARTIGVSRRGCILVVCTALSVPMVVFQSFSGYVDLYGAAAWLSALLGVCWATRVTDERGRRHLFVIAGLSAGVALGSKSTYMALVPLLGLVVMVVEWLRTCGTRLRRTTAVGNVVWFAAAATICSAFWFVRGTVQAGSPIYPITLETPDDGFLPTIGLATPVDKFPERTVLGTVKRWWDYPWREIKYGKGYTYGVGNALGAAYATFVPLGLVGAMIGIRSRGPGGGRRRRQLILLVLTLVGGAMLFTLFRGAIRFVLPFVVLSIPVAAVSVDRMVNRFPRYSPVLLTAALLVTAVIATLRPVHALLGRIRDGNWTRAWFYQVPAVVDGFEPGSRILNLSAEPMDYPLLGKHLNNVVINPYPWAPLDQPVAVSAEELRRRGIDYIFEREPWLENWPENWEQALPLELVYDDTESRPLATTPASRIYRVIDGGVGVAPAG